MKLINKFILAALVILITTSCDELNEMYGVRPNYSIQQTAEFSIMDNQMGYQVETKLIIHTGASGKYEILFGDFAHTKSESYGMLAEQLRDADSIISIFELR